MIPKCGSNPLRYSSTFFFYITVSTTIDIHVFLFLLLILVACSWRALRVQRLPNVDKPQTASVDVASSPAPSVLSPNTSWWEGFDDKTGDDMDLEELGKALSEAATFASQCSHSKKPQRNHHSETFMMPASASTRTRLTDANTSGLVMTWETT